MTTLADAQASGTAAVSSATTSSPPAETWRHFGTHLTLDGYGGDPALLNDMERVFAVLNELPDKLGMRKLITPYVIRVSPNDKKDPGGISGFVMIAESHISIHTFPGRRFVSIDLYTCQEELDSERTAGLFREAFGLRELELNVLERGRRFGELAPLV